jgi:hypothetical protein
MCVGSSPLQPRKSIYDPDLVEYYVVIKERTVKTQSKEEQERHEEMYSVEDASWGPDSSKVAKAIGDIPVINAPEAESSGAIQPMDTPTKDNLTDCMGIF